MFVSTYLIGIVATKVQMHSTSPLLMLGTVIAMLGPYDGKDMRIIIILIIIRTSPVHWIAWYFRKIPADVILPESVNHDTVAL